MSVHRFKTRQTSLWTQLDVDLHESEAEAKLFDERVRSEIKWKTEAPEGVLEAEATTSKDAPGDEGLLVRRQNIGEERSDNGRQSARGPTNGAEVSALPPLNTSFDAPIIHDEPAPIHSEPFPPRPSIPLLRPHLARLRPPTAISTPTSSRLTGNTTLPSIPTPKDMTTPLPAPVKRFSTSRLRQVAAQTPDAIASPIDTPNAPSTAASRAVAKDSTPIPLGSGSVVKGKAKKEYLALTEHYASFTKKMSKEAEKEDAAARAREQLKAGSRSLRSAARAPTLGLGGRVFDGLRFCVPLEIGPPAKQKNKWEIIHKLGGEVTITPDTATTHIVWDKTSASMLAQQLGLSALSELPNNTVIVKWQYIASCMLAAKLLDPEPFLSIPKNPFNRSTSVSTAGVSGLFKVPAKTGHKVSDMTGLKGKSTSISRKRAHTPTDSDTESPRKPKKIPPMRGRSGTIRDVVGPSRLGLHGASTTATTHTLPTGPGWEVIPHGTTDGLDELISGVVNGTIEAPEGDAIVDAHGAGAELAVIGDEVEAAGNPDPWGDRFKCGKENDGSSTGPNEWLARKFDEMHDLYQGVPGKNSFAIRQYMQAASVMRRTLYPITSGKDALRIKGVGQSIADRIDEFIRGGPGRLFYEDNEKTRTIAMFRDVYGVGRVLANELYRKGARTMDDLRAKGFGLTAGQLVGVNLYDDLNSRIPREECRQIFEIIRAEALAIDPKVWVEIMGSYRRGQETSGDVDILITRDTADGLDHSGVMKKLVDRLMVRGMITHELSAPSEWRALEAKWMGVGRLDASSKHRRIDILCVPFEQWGAALIYFTGNEIFNRSIRLYAHKKGYRLNQQGLFANVIRDRDGGKLTEGTIVASRTEQDIFDVLGLRWRHPHHRRP